MGCCLKILASVNEWFGCCEIEPHSTILILMISHLDELNYDKPILLLAYASKKNVFAKKVR